MKASAIVPARSAVLRGPMERAVLDLLTARLAAVSLAGYIFFGSSVNISDQACFQDCPGMFRQATRFFITISAMTSTHRHNSRLASDYHVSCARHYIPVLLAFTILILYLMLQTLL